MNETAYNLQAVRDQMTQLHTHRGMLTEKGEQTLQAFDRVLENLELKITDSVDDALMTQIFRDMEEEMPYAA